MIMRLIISVFLFLDANLVSPENCDEYATTRSSDQAAYFSCKNGTWYKTRCPTIQNLQKFFDPIRKICIHPIAIRSKRQLPSGSGSQRVGEFCSFNTDCTSGGYCESGICACWSTHVNINSYCWRRINPDESGCQYDRQCSAVYPGAFCNSGRVCKCPFSRPPTPTRDGPVCHVPGECPTNSQYPKLRDAGTETLSACTFLSTPAQAGLFIGCDLWLDVYECFDNSYCCPGRVGRSPEYPDVKFRINVGRTSAITCIQPMAEGTTAPGSSTSTRYYYNSITQSCLSFTFLGAEGNANNFLTIDQCQSYCKQHCERGPAEYNAIGTVSRDGQSLIRYCTTTTGSSSACSSNHECTQIGSQQMCCPRPSYVCGIFGGVVPVVAVIPPNAYNEGSTRGTTATVTRWYWDNSFGRCTTFPYRGQGGNFNNFLSQSDCESYCSQALCSQGTPLTDNSGFQNLACSSDAGCPTTHYCTNSVCCPTVQTVCNQPQAPGANCNSPSTRYWYNAATGTCVQFQYNGCQGNANNFQNLLDCQNYCTQIENQTVFKERPLKDGNNNFYQCSSSSGLVTGGALVIQQCPAGYECYFDGIRYGCCPTQTYTCTRPSDSGRACNPSSSTRWYFDTTTSTCRSFQYFGCDGNSNNFAVQRDCEDYCGGTGCLDGGDPYQELGGRIRICSSRNPCPPTHVCTVVNLNRVENTLLTTTSYCCPRKSTICALNRDTGANCGNSISRYFYNSNTRTCESFVYFGCAGNANNFPTLQSCLSFCNSAACDAGERAYVDPVTNNVQICNVGVINSCPLGYTCVFDSLLGQNVCCGAGDLGVCPSGQRAFVDGLTNSARQCTPNIIGSCPGNYLCVYNANRRLYYCCGSRTTTICPNNAVAYIDRTTNQPLACTLNAVNVCPAGFSCQTTSSSGLLYGYCCTGSIQGSIGLCGTGDVYLVNNQPVSCNPNSPGACISPYVCQATPAGNQLYYCCNPNPSNVCPNNGAAYILNGQPQQCDSSMINVCPSSYSCVQRPGSSLFYCCSGSQYSAYCGDGRPLLIGGNQPQQCYPGTGATCPSNYVCELSTALNTYYCCTGSGCPIGYEAYLVGSVAQYCTPGVANTCPFGYSCLQSSTSGRNQCCRQTTSSIDACPNNANAFIDPSTGRPQLCNAVGFTCSQGYSCIRGTAGNSICCQAVSTISQSCPGGQTPFISASTGRPRTCSSQFGNCPENYLCQLGRSGSFLCCPVQTIVTPLPPTPVCPPNTVGYIDPSTGRIQVCSVGTVSCPSGYSCMQVSVGGSSLCCSQPPTPATTPPPITRTCSGGGVPYIDPSTGLPQTCSPATIGLVPCPSGYTCEGSVCCPGAVPVVPGGNETGLMCDSGTEPFSINGQIQTCNRFTACPSGHICSYSFVRSNCCPTAAFACSQPLNIGSPCENRIVVSRYYFNTGIQQCQSFSYSGCNGNANNFVSLAACTSYCGSRELCPNSMQPLRAGSTFQGCLFGFPNNCPQGYQCQMTSTFRYRCCPGSYLTGIFRRALQLHDSQN